MPLSSILYIILIGILALVLALLQYGKKLRSDNKHIFWFALRFLTYLTIGVLLLNPKLEKVSVYEEKPNLLVAVDNSASIEHLEKTTTITAILENLRSNDVLNNRFNVQYFSFGDGLRQLDSLNYDEKNSNIVQVLREFNQVYTESTSPTLLLTDGNQTKGVDYDFESMAYKQAVFPIILGDSTQYKDLAINQLNANRYAYFKNQFPVEVFISYNGNEPLTTTLEVKRGNQSIKRIPISFDADEGNKVVNFTLPANTVGVQQYQVRLAHLVDEKNKNNNTKPFAIEVIDQKSNIAIIHSYSHPDIGSLKKAIESSEQREVTLVSPSEYVSSYQRYQLAILYQPNAAFRAVYDILETNNLNSFVIAGAQAQWSFLNEIQDHYEQEITGQSEDAQGILNNSYNNFIVNNLQFETFPPLKVAFGAFSPKVPYDPILFQSIKGLAQNVPLLFTTEQANKREAVLLGSGIWRWRAQHFLDQGNFQEFDDFINKLVQYLASSKRTNRLTLNYESFYTVNDAILFSAQYFNKNYEFDNKARLEIRLKNKADNTTTVRPFVIRQNNFQVDLSDINAGEYDFTVTANNGELQVSGSFSILAFNLEEQFLNADYQKLQRVAENTNGTAYFDTNIDALIDELNQDERFKTLQRSTKNVVPLIDFKWLLALLVLLLATEWFSRKYNGLI